jgi:predicted  nucleic acid-binding Zn-ribbon protein
VLQQAEQLKQLKTTTTDEIAFYEEKIKEHQEALEKAKDRLKRLDNK